MVFAGVAQGLEVPTAELLRIRTSLSNAEVTKKLYEEKTIQVDSLTVISTNQKKIIYKQNERINSLETREYYYWIAIGAITILGLIF
jgi:hypothetical protein